MLAWQQCITIRQRSTATREKADRKGENRKKNQVAINFQSVEVTICHHLFNIFQAYSSLFASSSSPSFSFNSKCVHCAHTICLTIWLNLFGIVFSFRFFFWVNQVKSFFRWFLLNKKWKKTAIRHALKGILLPLPTKINMHVYKKRREKKNG